MDQDAERFVIACARDGSQEAWRRLFEWHFDAVYGFCLALADGRKDIAEELTQQVFVTTAGRIHRFQSDRGTFRAWLCGIARNHHLALQAKEGRRRRLEAQRPVDVGTPNRSEPALLIHETLARLPGRYRRVLEDKYLKRLTMKEMAQADGRSIEAIESLLRRARDRFAPIYESIRNERQQRAVP